MQEAANFHEQYLPDIADIVETPLVRKDDAGRLAVYGATKAAFKNLASQCAAVGCFL